MSIQVYDPNYQQKRKGSNRGARFQEGRLEMIRVKKLKFALKGSNCEGVQNARLSGKVFVLMFCSVWRRYC